MPLHQSIHCHRDQPPLNSPAQQRDPEQIKTSKTHRVTHCPPCLLLLPHQELVKLLTVQPLLVSQLLCITISLGVTFIPLDLILHLSLSPFPLLLLLWECHFHHLLLLPQGVLTLLHPHHQGWVWPINIKQLHPLLMRVKALNSRTTT